jgi:hypothetical protein
LVEPAVLEYFLDKEADSSCLNGHFLSILRDPTGCGARFRPNLVLQVCLGDRLASDEFGIAL